MKTFLSGHWEKFVALLGLLLLAAGLFMDFVPGGPPQVVADSNKLVDELQKLVEKAAPEVLSAPGTSGEVAASLARHPGSFDIPKGLINYGGGASEEAVAMTAGEDKVYPVKPMNSLEVLGDDKEVVEAAHEDDEHVRIKALKPGSVIIKMSLNGRDTGGILKVRVRAKTRIELWPPVLQKPAASPDQPGEINLSWSDDPRTTAGATLGYVVERRSPAGSGEFKPLPGLEGRMLPSSMRRWTDEVEPSRRYEYRVRAVGSPSVTHVMPE